jgi:transposase-like protein
MIRHMAQRMMDMDVESLCAAAYGERSPERANSRNGYRERTWETRGGSVDLKIPKLRKGSYFPGPPGRKSKLHRRILDDRPVNSVLEHLTQYIGGPVCHYGGSPEQNFIE